MRCSTLLIEKCELKLQWGITSYWSEWPSPKSLQIINARRGVEKREPSYIVGGNANWHNHQREQYGDSLKTKIKTTICSRNPTPGHLSAENSNSERYMHYNVHYSTIYNSQEMEAT